METNVIDKCKPTDRTYFSEVLCLTKTYNLNDFADWLHWYIDIIHFDHIVVYDNESPQDIKTLCERYRERVEYHAVNGHPDQYGIYMEHINKNTKSTWVIPLDDDEILYIGDKYRHDVNTFIRDRVASKKGTEVEKIAAVWANMLSYNPIQSRSSAVPYDEHVSLIDTHTYVSRRACMMAQDFRCRFMEGWIKCFVRTDKDIEWIYNVYNGIMYNKGHNPTDIEKKHAYALLPNGRWTASSQNLRHIPSPDCFIAHYSLKSHDEWIAKCERPCVSNPKYTMKGLSSFYDDVYRYREWFAPMPCVRELFHGHEQIK